MVNENLDRQIFGELRSRGVSKPSEFAHLTDATILDVIQWYDAQGDRVGPGVLVAELRKANRRPARRDLMAEQRAYAGEIVAWLRQGFPDLDQPRWGPHPAAVAAVIRLHWRHGKGNLTVREHGREIRAAVERWEDE